MFYELLKQLGTERSFGYPSLQNGILLKEKKKVKKVLAG